MSSPSEWLERHPGKVCLVLTAALAAKLVQTIFFDGLIVTLKHNLFAPHWPFIITTSIITIAFISLLVCFDETDFAYIYISFICIFLVIDCFANLYLLTESLTEGGKIVKDGGTALYFSVITWVTVGYGDEPRYDGRRALR